MITEKMLLDLKKDLQHHLKVLEETYQVKIGIGRIGFTKEDFHFELKGFDAQNSKNEDWNVRDLELKKEYEKNYFKYGLALGDYGTEITIKGQKAKLVGCKCAGCTYPLVFKTEDGRYFKASINTLWAGQALEE